MDPKKIKICYLSSVLTVHDYRFLAELAKRNFDVYLVTYFDGEIPGDIGSLDKVTIIHRRPKYFRRIQKYLFAAKAADFRGILKEIQPDILQGGWVWKDGFLAALSGFHPFLLMPWGSDILEHTRPSERWPLSRLVWPVCRRIAKYTIRRADRVVCDCEKVKDKVMEIAGYPEDKVGIFSWGIDLDRFQPGSGAAGIRRKAGWEGNKVLISTRSFYPEYEIERLIEALPLVIGSEPSVRVMLAGEGPRENRLRDMVKDKGLEDFVRFVGAVPNPEIPDYLNAADIYVSSAGTDGTSISLLEAFACGLPVVAIKDEHVSGNDEWIQDGVNGFLALAGDTERFAQSIITLLKEPDTRKNMRERNLEIAKGRADWKKNFDGMERIYIRLAEDHKE